MNRKFGVSSRIIYLAAVVFIISISCKKDVKADLNTGDNYQGGIIFYLDDTGEHGLICAIADQSTTDPWWNGSYVATGAVSTSDGSGNTTAIIAAQGNTGNYAARLCRNYNGGGYSDWFLPSKEQLNMLFNNKALIGGFTGHIYWSSTEYELGTVWVQDFQSGQQHLDSSSDGANVRARAIRSF